MEYYLFLREHGYAITGGILLQGLTIGFLLVVVGQQSRRR